MFINGYITHFSIELQVQFDLLLLEATIASCLACDNGSTEVIRVEP